MSPSFWLPIEPSSPQKSACVRPRWRPRVSDDWFKSLIMWMVGAGVEPPTYGLRVVEGGKHPFLFSPSKSRTAHYRARREAFLPGIETRHFRSHRTEAYGAHLWHTCRPFMKISKFRNHFVGVQIASFRSSIPTPPIPLFTLRRAPRDAQRKTRGRVDR